MRGRDGDAGDKSDVEREGFRVRGARHGRWFRKESTDGRSDREQVLSARDQTCTNKERKSRKYGHAAASGAREVNFYMAICSIA